MLMDSLVNGGEWCNIVWLPKGSFRTLKTELREC